MSRHGPSPQRRECLRIDALSYGPHGVGRLDGKVIFVRGVVPGEEVDVHLREDRGSFAYADLAGIITPAAARRVPPCPYLPRCGGCPWQHVEYGAQLRAKEQNVRDHLQRLGAIPDVDVRSILPSPREFGYRSRLSLRTEAGRVGFYAAGSHRLQEVAHCLLGGEAVDGAITAAAEVVRRLRSAARRVEVVARGAAPGAVLLVEIEGHLAPGDDDIVTTCLAQHESVAGIVLQGKRWRRRWGDDRITLSPEDGVTLTGRCGAFTQVNPAGNRRLVETVCALGRFGAHEDVLDLYAGIGNLTIPIARRVRSVVAVEQTRLAAASARANARAPGCGHVEVVASTARAYVRAVPRGRVFHAVVLDPPRGGAADALDGLLALAPPRLVYVSCNPATLARDLKVLARRYRIDAVQPLDLFPHSYHVETVVSAVLTC